MINSAMTALSNTLFTATLLAYLVALVAAFFGLAFTRVQVAGLPSPNRAGRWVRAAATGIAALGTVAHLTSVVTRGLAAGRVPWGNMYEYGSVLALIAVATGLVVILRKREYAGLLGFFLAAAVLMMASSLLLFAEAGPLQPALGSYWIKIHVSGMMVSSSILIVGFVATALYLVKDTAERRVARTQTFGASSVGAGSVVVRDDAVEGRVEGDHLEERVATPEDQRATLSPLLFPVVPFAVVAAFTLLVWRQPLAAMAAGSAAALLGTAAWYAVPHLPPAARLDALAYRVIAFGFPILSFGVICGAIWAEETWGRYWGWDPKETGSFVTWVLYACYLHARSTHGWRGRGAGWIGVIAFTALMVTYYAVNLFVVGLHSYAGV